jgi:hypothetical protein
VGIDERYPKRKWTSDTRQIPLPLNNYKPAAPLLLPFPNVFSSPLLDARSRQRGA